MKTVDFSETIAACDLKVGRRRQLIEIMKVFFQVLCFTRPRYQVSVYRTIGPLVIVFSQNRDSGYTHEYSQSMFQRKK